MDIRSSTDPAGPRAIRSGRIAAIGDARRSRAVSVRAHRGPRTVRAVTTASAESRFRSAYGAHRAAEGRGLDRASMLQLPYLSAGPLAKQWGVRARTFDAFMTRILRPMARQSAHPL